LAPCVGPPIRHFDFPPRDPQGYTAGMQKRILSILVAASLAGVVRADEPKHPSMLGAEAAQVRDDNGLKMKLVGCPPGEFAVQREEIGDAASGKQPIVTPVRVVLSHGYWLGTCEVTQSQWKRTMGTEP